MTLGGGGAAGGHPNIQGAPQIPGEHPRVGREPQVTLGEDAAQVNPGALVCGVGEDGVLHQLQLWGRAKGTPQNVRGAVRGHPSIQRRRQGLRDSRSTR